MSKIGKTIKAGASVIKRAIVTEKAAAATGAGAPVYTFLVAPEANKVAITAALKAKYKVTPVKVNVINVPSKRIFVRRKPGVKSGYKKALVYLRPGDKIEVI